MKKMFLLTIGFLTALGLSAQGWVGNSATNTIYPVNSALSTTPISVGIGTATPQERLQLVNGNLQLDDNSANGSGSTLGNLLFGSGRTWLGNNGMRVSYTNAAEGGYIDVKTDANNKGLIFRLDQASGGTERMRINSNGNVGIGVNNPTEQLHSNLGVRFEGLSRLDTPSRVIVQDNTGKLYWRPLSLFGMGNNWSLVGNSATNASTSAIGSTVNNNFIGTTNNQSFVMATNNLERMRIAANGFIGIGTINPVVQFTNSNFHSGNNAGFGTTVASGLDWHSAGQGYVASFYNSSAANSENNGVLIKTLNTGSGSKVLTINSGNLVGGNDLMTVLGNGNVGIGTVTPSEQLHVTRNLQLDEAGAVNGSTFGNILLGLGQTWNGNNGMRLAFNNNGTTIGGGYIDVKTDDPSKGLVFRVDQSTGVTERLAIIANGNVGIGTSAPQDLLHIEGRARITDLPMSNPNDNLVMADPNTGELRSLSPGVPNTFLRSDGTWANIPASGGNTTNNCTGLNMVPRLTGVNTYSCGQIFDNTASVGINQTTGFTFTTSAWRSTGATTTGTFRLRVGGNIGGTALYATSDQTLKTNINSIKNSIDLIKKLEGKTYEWTDDFAKESALDKGIKFGFLAQEVEKVMPEAVIKDENGRYAVEYNAFIPVLVESQKAIIAENEDLKSKLSSLESDNAMMKEKFALLERTIAQLCESGCAGLGKKTDIDALYQSIPNPTDSEALINYYLSREYKNATISVYNQVGKEMKTVKLESSKGNGSIKINLSDLSSGTYIYTLVAGERIIDSKKLQIVK